MKIVIDARIINTSTGRYVRQLLEYLQAIDHENQYIILLLKSDFTQWQPKADNFRKIVADYPIYTFREQINLAILLYRLRPNLVHFTMPQHPILYFGRHVTTIHDLTLLEVKNERKLGFIKGLYKNHFRPFVFRSAMRWFISSSKYIITPTNFTRLGLIRSFSVNPNKVIVTYESHMSDTIRPQKPSFMANDDKYIMYLGNAYPYKNVWRLVLAFNELDRPNLKLILVGKTSSYYRGLKARATRNKIEGVIFAGFIPDEQTTWLYQHAQAFVTASTHEGFGLPALEAMNFGCATLASDASCMPEVYGDGARYFNPLDPTDIAKQISYILDNPIERAKLISRGKVKSGEYSWEKMAMETLAIYNKFSRDGKKNKD